MKTGKYVAFLRGINVGGNKKVSMEKLRKVLEGMGFTNVKTILNSGNVVFEIGITTSINRLTIKIEEALEKKFKFPIPTLLRSFEDIQKLVATQPFAGIIVTPQTRLYITFLSHTDAESVVKIPYDSAEKDFNILRISDGAICSVLTLSPKRNTTDVMKVLEKEYGPKITTRNWNTIQKVADIMRA
jgi:uncharacterized protein (DUF1697 family)